MGGRVNPCDAAKKAKSRYWSFEMKKHSWRCKFKKSISFQQKQNKQTKKQNKKQKESKLLLFLYKPQRQL